MTKIVNVKDFAQRVERLCDYILDKTKRDGSQDLVVLQQLKEDAADLQIDDSEFSFEGLSDYMKGAP